MIDKAKRFRRMQYVFLIFMLMAMSYHKDGWSAIFGFISVLMYLIKKNIELKLEHNSQN